LPPSVNRIKRPSSVVLRLYASLASLQALVGPFIKVVVVVEVEVEAWIGYSTLSLVDLKSLRGVVNN
jgi:hypothetical protein